MLGYRDQGWMENVPLFVAKAYVKGRLSGGMAR